MAANPADDDRSRGADPALPVGGANLSGGPGRAGANHVSDHLQLLEELDDALVGVAFVFDDLARLALFGGLHGGDLLAGSGPADLAGVDAEIGDSELLDRRVIGRHDPLERGG